VSVAPAHHVAIEEFCVTGSGGTPSRSNSDYYGGDIPWVKSGELRESVIWETGETITEEALKKSSAKIVPKGAILLAMYGATVGRLAILGVDAATNQAVCNIRPDPSKADAKYVYRALEAIVPQLISQATGGAQPNISQEKVRKTPIPLPPLDEQKRIAAILDKADALRAKRRQAIALLESLTQSIFLEMFGDPITNPKGWGLCRIEDFLESANYGSSGKAGPIGRYPILRMGNVTFDGRIDTTDLKYIDLSEHEVPKYTVRKGDLLFNRTNSADLVGKTAIFDLDDKYAFAGYLVRARTNERATPEYISAYLNSPYGKGLLRGMAKSIVGMANINAKEMQKISIPAPPKTLQDQFSVKLKRVAEMRHRILPSVVETDTLFASLQHRAFTGQL
jgi:type I restriction enzyme S subunit